MSNHHELGAPGDCDFSCHLTTTLVLQFCHNLAQETRVIPALQSRFHLDQSRVLTFSCPYHATFSRTQQQRTTYSKISNRLLAKIRQGIQRSRKITTDKSLYPMQFHRQLAWSLPGFCPPLTALEYGRATVLHARNPRTRVLGRCKIPRARGWPTISHEA